MASCVNMKIEKLKSLSQISCLIPYESFVLGRFATGTHSLRPLSGLCSFVLGRYAASVVSVIIVLGALRLDNKPLSMGYIIQYNYKHPQTGKMRKSTKCIIPQGQLRMDGIRILLSSILQAGYCDLAVSHL